VTNIKIRCRALLFDLDGVLIDSTPAVARVWRQWALEYGFDPLEVTRRAHGRPSLITVREYLPQADHLAENHEVERREIEDLEGVVPLPGALALLNALPAHRWTIVTSCTRALAEVRLRAAGLPVPSRLVTAQDVTRSKPDPEPFQKGAAMLGVAPADCLVLEDSPAGIRAGKAAGARVLGLRAIASDAELAAAGADWLADNCSALSFVSFDGSGELLLRLDADGLPSTV